MKTTQEKTTSSVQLKLYAEDIEEVFRDRFEIPPGVPYKCTFYGMPLFNPEKGREVTLHSGFAMTIAWEEELKGDEPDAEEEPFQLLLPFAGETIT